MKKLAIVFACWALTLGFAASASAASTKWVDQLLGNDGNDGNSETLAYATLQFAIDNSISGIAGTPSVINVKGGTYGSAGAPNDNHCGASPFPAAIVIDSIDFLTIQAVPGQEPVIKPVTTVAANIVSLAIEDSNNLIIDNIDSDQTVAQFDNWHVCDSDDLTVRNSAFEGGEDGIDFNTDAMDVLIENNTFTDINTGNGDEVLDFTDGAYTGIVIQDNVFKNNYRQITTRTSDTGSGGITDGMVIQRNVMDGTTSQEAIRLIAAKNVTVVNNVIMNNLQQGLYIDSGSSNIDVLHNTFFNNDQEFGGNGEIRTKESSGDIVIKNNILNGNGSNPIIETATILPSEDFNLVFNDIGGFTFGTNTITGDPLFVDTTPGSEDLNLTAGSPAIDAGGNLGVTDDITGAARPVGAAPDMGAYEFFVSDSDGDGVDDPADLCPDTVIPEGGVPLRGLKPNRWALTDGDGDFDTVVKGKGKGKGKGPNRSYTIEDTAGCSCEQIIEIQGLGKGHTKFGCSISAMDDWVRDVNL